MLRGVRAQARADCNFPLDQLNQLIEVSALQCSGGPALPFWGRPAWVDATPARSILVRLGPWLVDMARRGRTVMAHLDQAAVRVPVTRGHHALILFGRKRRKAAEECGQIPYGGVLHSSLRPGRHRGRL